MAFVKECGCAVGDDYPFDQHGGGTARVPLAGNKRATEQVNFAEFLFSINSTCQANRDSVNVIQSAVCEK